MEKKGIKLKDVLLDDYFLDLVLNDAEGSFHDVLGLYNVRGNSPMDFILTEAQDVIMFDNADKSCLSYGESEDLKSRIINSILKK